MKAIVISHATWADLREIAAHIAVDNPRAAERFIDAFLLTADVIKNYPAI